MKVALAVWNGRIAPVFDVARQALILDIEDGRVVGREQRAFELDAPRFKAQSLADWGVETLICGAVSRVYAEMLALSAIKTEAFVAGEVEEIIAAYLGSRLHLRDYRMPGCRRCCRKDGGRRGVTGRRRACRMQ